MLDVEETTIWRDHESFAWLIHLWMSLDNSIMWHTTKGSNCPLLENNIQCPLTQFDECPLAYLLMMIAHWVMKMLTGCFVDVVETFSLKTILLISLKFPPLCQLKGEVIFSKLYLNFELPPFRCRRVSLLYSPVQLYECTIFIWLNPIVKLVQSSGCGWPFPGINPWIIYLQFYWLVLFSTLCWWMIWLATMVTRMEIKTLIFHMTSSLTMRTC